MIFGSGSGNGVSLLAEHAPRGQIRQVADAAFGAGTTVPKSVVPLVEVTVSENAHRPSVLEQVEGLSDG